MGAWGVRPFENDAALDWVAELESAGIKAIEDALERAARTSSPEADDASAAVAAAATVAAARGLYQAALPDDVVAWLASHGADISIDLVDQGKRALDAVMRSELQELWEESDELDAWSQTIQDISSGLLRPETSRGT